MKRTGLTSIRTSGCRRSERRVVPIERIVNAADVVDLVFRPAFIQHNAINARGPLLETSLERLPLLAWQHLAVGESVRLHGFSVVGGDRSGIPVAKSPGSNNPLTYSNLIPRVVRKFSVRLSVVNITKPSPFHSSNAYAFYRCRSRIFWNVQD